MRCGARLSFADEFRISRALFSQDFSCPEALGRQARSLLRLTWVTPLRPGPSSSRPAAPGLLCPPVSHNVTATSHIGANNNNVTLNKTRGLTFLTKTVGKYFLLKLHYGSLPDV